MRAISHSAKFSCLFMSALSLTLGGVALGQEPDRAAAQSDVNNEIIVVGLTDRFKFKPRQLEAAAREFAKRRDEYAPDSQLFFQIWPGAGDPVEGITISLRSNEADIPIAVDRDGKFALPTLPRGEWTLVTNRSRRRIQIVPVILSPGTADGDRLLGDLRLQCRVSWAISAPEVSIFVKGMFAAAGGCEGNKFAYYANANRNIETAVASDKAINKALQIWNGNKFRAPVGDRQLGNDARVRLTFKG